MYRIRFLKIMLMCFFRKPQPDILENYELSFRVWPVFDTDFIRLFTQTYSAWTGLGRWHYVFSSPFKKVASQNRWFPVTTAETITFKRSIRIGEKVLLKSELVCWNERCFFIRQTFLVGDDIRAIALSEGIVRRGKDHLNPIQVFQEMGTSRPSPEMPADIRAWYSMREFQKEKR